MLGGAVAVALSVGAGYVLIDAMRKLRKTRFKIVDDTDDEGRPTATLTYDSHDGFLRIYEFKQEYPDMPMGTPREQAQSWLDRFTA